MREVDQALARAYAKRDEKEPARSVPPAPHLPSRSIATVPDPVPETMGTAATVELQWPAVVLGLERDWGDRFDRLADRIVEARRLQNLRVLLFTSCHRAEGRTTLVLTLARALARRPGRTAVVDADLAGPMLARLLGLRPEIGLDDAIEGDRALADAMLDAPDDHLVLLPMRAAVARPREFLASSGWSRTIARLRREFDHVLLDGGPLFTGLGSAVLHGSVDAAVLVSHRELTGQRALLRAREALEEAGVPLLGVAETFV